MASGYIRLPNVPKNCFGCKLSDACAGTCAWVDRAITDANEKPGWCPIYLEGGIKAMVKQK